MSGAMPPLLRAPPFPWVKPELAAVSSASALGRDAPILSDGARDLVFAAICEARVGGTYWAPAPKEPLPPLRLLAASNADDARVLMRGGERDDGRIAVLLDRSGSVSGGGGICPNGPVDPWALLAGDVVVEASAGHELAALAIIRGAPVRLLGSGRFGSAEHGADPALVAAALMETPYRNPFSAEPSSIEATVVLLGEWRRLIEENHGTAVLSGIAWWKRRALAKFFWAPRRAPTRFVTVPSLACRAARAGRGEIVVWPSRIAPALPIEAAASDIALARVEDGFIRSLGLGSGLHPPLSIVVDRTGIHYDPTQPSDLETLLQHCNVSPELRARARALREAIVAGGIDKYGVGAATDPPPRRPSRLVLVPGQVSDDLSVRLGGEGMSSNAVLLERVRALEPDSEIWFRPHPDVDAGHRRGAITDDRALAFADRVVRGGRIADLLATVDGVHVLTSLTGFEALLRGRDVSTHGSPFFAGWGLTRDLGEPPARRTRRLDLDELVAAVLILYPRYLDPLTELPCPVEVLVERFSAGISQQSTLVTSARRLQGRIMRMLRRGAG